MIIACLHVRALTKVPIKSKKIKQTFSFTRAKLQISVLNREPIEGLLQLSCAMHAQFSDIHAAAQKKDE